MTETSTKRRLYVLGLLIVFMFSVLSVRLWFLQVMAREDFQGRADRNRVRLVPDPAPRGRILDRNGELLVSNRQSRILRVDRTLLPKDEEERVVAELAGLLGISPIELGERLQDVHYYPFEPVPIAFDVPEEVALYVGEHDDDFPGVDVDVTAVRQYPSRNLAAHILGHTGEISAEDLELPEFEGYRQGTQIGTEGLERSYEFDLQGEEGVVSYEVNARGDVLRRLGLREPVAGADLVLSIDAKLQRAAQSSLRQGLDLARGTYDKSSGRYLKAGGGAALVLDARNGRVLAMSSLPTFDPGLFVGGISTKDFERLTAKDANSPLLNRAVSSVYPPGSTFKPFVGAAAVREKITSLDSFTECPPDYGVENDPSGHRFRNWESVHRGHLSLGEALVRSCDTVFYQWGHEFFKKRVVRGEIFQSHLEDFGFGHKARIDLPTEARGLIPTVEWKEETSEHNPFITDVWLPGDDINMSIGQGNVQVSPLQLAVAYAAIANGGKVYEPRLGLRLQRSDGSIVRRIKPRAVGQVPFSPHILSYIREHLRGVVTSGTAAGAFAGYPHDRYPLAGKTGTAEMPPRQDFSWFAGYSMVPDKPYVVVAMIEEGGHGSTTAAPVVRRIFEHIFGIEATAPLQTGGSTD